MKTELLISKFDYITPILLSYLKEAKLPGKQLIAVCMSDQLIESAGQFSDFATEDRVCLAEALDGVASVYLIDNFAEVEKLKANYPSAEVRFINGNIVSDQPEIYS